MVTSVETKEEALRRVALERRRQSPAHTKRVKVFVLEEQEISRETYKVLLSTDSGIEIIGLSDSAMAEDFASTISPLTPDVVIVGIKTLHPNLIEKLELLRQQCPNVGLILLATHYDVQGIKRLREFAQGGSKGCAYLLKHSIDTVGQLIQVIHSVVEGRVILDAALMEGLIAARDSRASLLRDLTPRELEVLTWMAKGYKNSAIADVLCLDHKTVERHINGIYSKLQATVGTQHPRVHAVMVYLQAMEEAVVPQAESMSRAAGLDRGKSI